MQLHIFLVVPWLPNLSAAAALFFHLLHLSVWLGVVYAWVHLCVSASGQKYSWLACRRLSSYLGFYSDSDTDTVVMLQYSTRWLVTVARCWQPSSSVIPITSCQAATTGLSSCGTSELLPVSDKSSFVFVYFLHIADAGVIHWMHGGNCWMILKTLVAQHAECCKEFVDVFGELSDVAFENIVTGGI